MKNSKEVLEDIYERRDKYLAAQKEKKNKIMKAVLAGTALVLLCVVGIIIVKNNSPKNDKKEKSTQKDNISSENKVILNLGDMIVYERLDELLRASDLVVIGSFVDEGEETGIAENGETKNRLKIEKVIQGNAEVNDELIIIQRYAHDSKTGNMLSFSALTPMREGDRWLYFLIENENEKYGKYYYAAGDYCGRFPVTVKGEINAQNMGVYEETYVKKELYDAILNNIDLSLDFDVEPNNTYDYTENLIVNVP